MGAFNQLTDRAFMMADYGQAEGQAMARLVESGTTPTDAYFAVVAARCLRDNDHSPAAMVATPDDWTEGLTPQSIVIIREAAARARLSA